MTSSNCDLDYFQSEPVLSARADLTLALRAAAHYGLAESVCNHFSMELPDVSGRFLLNPRVACYGARCRRATSSWWTRGAKSWPGFTWWNSQPCTFMQASTALTLTQDRCLDTTLSQNAMRFHGRVVVDDQYNGLALDAAEGERIARALQGADVAFLGNHGVVVCGSRIDYAFDDLYFLERACMAQVLAQSTGQPLAPVQAAIAAQVAQQMHSERLQSELFFQALRRTL